MGETGRVRPGGDAEPRVPAGQIARALAVLEAVAEHGSSTAKDLAELTGIPLPTVYRIAHELMRAEYLVHLREEGRFALGYQLHRLAVGLHDDLGVSRSVQEEMCALRDATGMAVYLAVHRGPDFVVVFVADSDRCRRLEPMGFGFHDYPHATAFGKLGLSSLSAEDRAALLDGRELVALTPRTITSREVLEASMQEIARTGTAWEHEEFQRGTECLAIPIKADDGALIGSVAVSAPCPAYAGRRRHVEHRVRSCAARVSRLYRLGRQVG